MAAMSDSLSHHDPDDWTREILITADEMDIFHIKKYILPDFDSFKISYYFQHRDDYLAPGGWDIGSRHAAVKRCKKILLILSQKGMRHFPLEMYLAIEKSLKMGEMRLIVLLINGMTQKDVPKIPWLETASYIKLDDNVHEMCMMMLCKLIKRDEPIHNKLPVGNVGRGMAWSHFLGYLKVVLPDLPNVIQACRFYRSSNDRVCMPIKFYMLLPRSGKGPKGQNNLECLDPRLKYEDKLEMKIKVNGSLRIFTPNVYSITDPQSGMKYYCLAEIPSAFCALGSIFMDALGKIDAHQLDLEVERFYYQIDFLLSHQNSQDCHNKVVILPYNDEDKTGDALPGSHLLRACQKSLQCLPPGRPILGSVSANYLEGCSVPCDQLYHQTEPQDEHQEDQIQEDQIHEDVCLICCACDRENAENIKTFLESKKKIVSVVTPEREGFEQTEKTVRAARWSVLFLSEASMHVMEFWLGELLTIGNLENCQRLLPVLLDTHPDNIPDFLSWVTFITTDEPDYAEKINHIIEGESVTFTTQIPIGNVAEGLVWVFYANYLRHNLQDIPRRIKKKLKECSGVNMWNIKYSTVLFELVPKSCKCPKELASPGGQISDEGPIESVQKTIWGTQRTFTCNLYKINLDNGKQYYFLGEFASPVRTLYSMHQSLIAGLSKQLMEEQVHLFAIQLQKVVKSKISNSCEVIMYDDAEDNLVDILVKRIVNHEEKMQQLEIEENIEKIHQSLE
ncbi:uncharacterized protein LOC132552763 [Ylistrum balloti]|uniref:uncharacterized protein LOC132552763 n=1 Tax=Ylistrum balloti TaxID=509963 RepID=UPI002905F129|nr:uncharacterized protein LOC132552763 [Ylistrum balloti]